MKDFDITRPDKLILSGLKTLGNLTLSNLPLNLYSDVKSEAKGTGELTFIGERKLEDVRSQLFKYDLETFEIAKDLESFSFLSKPLDKIHWLNFHGLHDVELIKQVSKSASLDRITTRQILDTTLRPKVEDYDHYIFFSVKSVLKDLNQGLKVEQLSFVLGKNFVISFQEEIGDHFDHIRNKIEEKLGILHKKGADFLLYQLLDAILDNYFETIESLNNEIVILEKIVLSNPTQESLVQLEGLKRTSEMIKKSLNPFKDSLKVIVNRRITLIEEGNYKYMSDLMNSCNSAIEEIDATMSSIGGLTNIYFSSLSHKMNETMKVLTTVATIFIPLTFIVGVYGMNFVNMPELQNPYGYYYTWGLMGLIFVGMIIYFKLKKWL